MGIKQRRERERETTRQAILQAALEIATEEGWRAVTIRKVAERIEYSPSAIYKYFEDKKEILHTLLLQGFQQVLASLEYIVSQEQHTTRRLLGIAVTYWDFAWRQPTLYQLMFDLKGKLYEVQEVKSSFLLVRTAIEEWSRANEVQMDNLDRAVAMFWAVMHGFVDLALDQCISGGPEQARESLIQAASDLLLAWKTRLAPSKTDL